MFVRPALLAVFSAGALMLAACGEDGPRPVTHGGEAQPGVSEDAAREILIGFGQPYLGADLDNGRRLFRRCATCHTLAEGGRHRVGPNLHGVFGSEAGAREGFPYSPALRSVDFEWTPEELDAWLANPRTYLPGNRMSFAGIRGESDRDDLIAFLAVQTAQ